MAFGHVCRRWPVEMCIRDRVGSARVVARAFGTIVPEEDRSRADHIPSQQGGELGGQDEVLRRVEVAEAHALFYGFEQDGLAVFYRLPGYLLSR